MSKSDVLEMVYKYLTGLYNSHIDGVYNVRDCDHMATGFLFAVSEMTGYKYDTEIRKIYGAWIKDNKWNYGNSGNGGY